MNKTPLASVVLAALLGGGSSMALAQAVESRGLAEVAAKEFKDPAAARLAARKSAEKDAVKAALRLKQNIDVGTAAVEQAVPEIVKALGDNLRTTFAQEGDTLIARTALRVDGAELSDIVRSMNLQNKNAMASAAIVFFIDEYWGIGTRSDPALPVSTETEYFHDKTARSDTSAKASGSAYSDTSAKQSSASAYDGRLAASSKESASMSANSRSSVSGNSSASFSGDDRRSVSLRDGEGGAAAASRNASLAASRSDAYAGSQSGSVAAARSADNRVQASVQSSNAQASDVKNVKAASFSGEQKNVQQQNDIVSMRTKTVYPEMGNSKPVSSSLVSTKLAETMGQYGLRFTSEQDLRETGKGRMLIADIATQGRYRTYIDKAAAPPYNARYVVFGTAQMRTDGKAADGDVMCSGELTFEAISVAGGNNLPSATVVKTATARGDELCRARLADAMAAEVGAKAGNAASRELQMAASQGSSYTITLYSVQALSRRIARPFEDALGKLFGADSVADGGQTDAVRVYQVAAKGSDVKRRLEGLIDGLGDGMGQAEVRSNGGTRFVVCVEGKCPTSF